MKTLLFLACLTVSLSGFSQEPFGKHFSVSLKQGFSMVDIFSLDFVGHNRLSVNYVFGKNFMIGLDGNYSYANYNKYTYLNNWENAPQIRDLSIGASFYYFRNKEGGYAPTGRYFFISASHGIANKYRVEKVTTGSGWNQQTNNNNYMNSEVTRKSTILAIGFGRNFILNKRILLGYSLDFGFDLRGAEEFGNRYVMRPSIQIGYTF